MQFNFQIPAQVSLIDACPTLDQRLSNAMALNAKATGSTPPTHDVSVERWDLRGPALHYAFARVSHPILFVFVEGYRRGRPLATFDAVLAR